MNELKKEERVEQISEKIIYWGETTEEKTSWGEGKAWCEKQGGRLPTLDELEKAYKDGVSGFNDEGTYWSSTPYVSDAYYVRFSDCSFGGALTYYAYSVRCVYDK